IIEQLGDITSDPFNTAIVLADENMLMPVLNSLPLSVTDINITMGYPLHQTPVYSLVHRLLSLQKRRREEGSLVTFYYADVLKILKHQYISFLFREECEKALSMIRDQNLVRVPADDLMFNEFFSKLFVVADDHISLNRYIGNVLLEVISFMTSSDGEDESGSGRLSLQQEYLYILIKSINQLDTLFNTSGLTPGKDIYSRIIEKVMLNINVPFSGEPLCGLQVMGILETRVLDFENIIFVSVNEGILPKGSPGNTYIPYNLRMAFGLPTIKHQDSIYAYYFYRLLQRSKKIRFLYNSGSGGLRTGEMSRFLLQLKYSEKLKPQFAETRFMIMPHERVPEKIIRTETIQEFLEKKYIQPGAYRSLSPSALNAWNSCSMRFYYRYIAGIKEADDVQSEVDSLMFGNILHHAMKNLYGDFWRTIITGDVIEALIEDTDRVNSAVEGAFREIMMNRRQGNITGRNLIIISVISDLVKQIMRIDSRFSPIKIVSLEEKYKTGLTVERGNKKFTIFLEGTIDRVDIIDGKIRILDYKSGRDNLDIRSLDELFEENGKYKNSAAFQTLVYCFIYLRNNPGTNLRPSLYPVRLIYDNSFSDIFNIKDGIGAGSLDDFSKINDHFVSCLTGIIGDIFDPERDFEMTSETSVCRYCTYNKLCDRQDVK
ncbi:MAG: PD-(D/E)XK nuclease family protein, partial [Bacteroidales bacterium]|nr:PD-(D/E)XK nuclease family protein [Bacteroidales bacterium]